MAHVLSQRHIKYYGIYLFLTIHPCKTRSAASVGESIGRGEMTNTYAP